MRVLVILVVLAFSACATTKIPIPTGGSKAAATVNLSYQYSAFEKPVVDWAKADAAATNRCRAWGYARATPFGGETNGCSAMGPYGCTQVTVTKAYQCLPK